MVKLTARGKIKISTFTTKNRLNKTILQQGFSLLEILVVIALLSLVVMVGVTMTAPEKDVALEATNLMERAVRYGVNEAALRNSVIRLHFYFDTEPQKFTVEYGPDDDYVIPLSELNQGNKDDLSESEQKDLEDRIKSSNQEFNTLPEFKDDAMKIPDNVKIIGIGNLMHEKLLYDFEGSIYLYPTGEKDESIIFFATYYELVSITIPAFTLDFNIERHPFDVPLDSEEEIFDKGISKAAALFEDWRKVK